MSCILHNHNTCKEARVRDAIRTNETRELMPKMQGESLSQRIESEIILYGHCQWSHDCLLSDI